MQRVADGAVQRPFGDGSVNAVVERYSRGDRTVIGVTSITGLV
jgi:hypothetical protein